MIISSKKTVFLVLILVQAAAFCFEQHGEKKPAVFESLTFSAAPSIPTVVSPEQRHSRTFLVCSALFKTAFIWDGREIRGRSEILFRECRLSGFPQTLQTLGCQLTI